MEIEEEEESSELDAYDITKPRNLFKKYNEKWTKNVLN